MSKVICIKTKKQVSPESIAPIVTNAYVMAQLSMLRMLAFNSGLTVESDLLQAAYCDILEESAFNTKSQKTRKTKKGIAK